jgi:hypothetical protein
MRQPVLPPAGAYGLAMAASNRLRSIAVTLSGATTDEGLMRARADAMSAKEIIDRLVQTFDQPEEAE